MKADCPLKHFFFAFLLALGCYALAYWAIEHRRNRQGPWDVAFLTNSATAPVLVINQPRLGIRNFQIAFPGASVSATQGFGRGSFGVPRPVPYDVPFGQCVFMDTTFLPGTLTFQLFGHEIELLPRVLIVDHIERPWHPNSAITLPVTNLPGVSR